VNFGVLDEGPLDRDAVEAVQYIDNGGVEVGLEQPVLGRSFDPEPVLGQAADRVFGGVLGDDQVDVVGVLRRAVHPQGVATGECERHRGGLERRCGAFERRPQAIVR
jgi:hypothetical protein